ncbi:MAG: inorganic pyrophosphatase [Bacteroidetes bacterium]|nr:MAG: inorganic pyrophosphatase [Bacteroidota bacterium]
MSKQFQSHPWHGISPGEEAPGIVNAFIEIVPGDTVKYEIDKASGWLKVDRPQKFSNIVPALYGFIPQTYCGEEIAKFCAEKSGLEIKKGDGDPLDICVFSERNITGGGILLKAIPVGGLRLVDKNEADDKIIAVMQNDDVYSWNDISQFPPALIQRLRHYFLTYKNIPGDANRVCEITHVYGREEALEVIRKSMTDYQRTFAS